MALGPRTGGLEGRGDWGPMNHSQREEGVRGRRAVLPGLREKGARLLSLGDGAGGLSSWVWGN